MNAYWRAANYLSVGQIISTTIRFSNSRSSSTT
jgi:phosphoketolase